MPPLSSASVTAIRPCEPATRPATSSAALTAPRPNMPTIAPDQVSE